MAEKETKESRVDTEKFTQEVESAIDDLFQPVKSIEIDPVTNEVKEVAPPPDKEGTSLGLEELGLELELEEGAEEVPPRAEGPEAAGEAPQEPVSEEAEEPEALQVQEEAPSQGLEELAQLELEIEDLELEEAEPAVSPPEEAQEEDHGRELRFSQLYEAALALEWEVSPRTVGEFREAVAELERELKEGVQGPVQELLQWCRELAAVLEATPQRMHPGAPKLLSQAVGQALAAMKGEEGAEEELSGLLQRLQELKAPEPKEPQPAPPQEGPAEPSPPPPELEELRRSLEEAERALEQERERSARLVEAVQVHLRVLDECIDKMEGLEAVLKGMKGLEKLLRFNAWIHARLQGEKVALSEALEGSPYDLERVKEVVQTTLRVVEASVALSEVKEEARARQEAEAPRPRPTPPFRQLMVAELGEEWLGFLPEEVAMVVPASKKVVQAVRSGGSLPLNRLRRWPWSRISSLAGGELAGVPESRLRAMSLPVLAPQDPSSVDQLVEPHLVVLYRAGRGGVALVDGPLQERPVQEGDRWAPAAQGGAQLGTFTTPVHSIRVISVQGA